MIKEKQQLNEAIHKVISTGRYKWPVREHRLSAQVKLKSISIKKKNERYTGALILAIIFATLACMKILLFHQNMTFRLRNSVNTGFNQHYLFTILSYFNPPMISSVIRQLPRWSSTWESISSLVSQILASWHTRVSRQKNTVLTLW